MVHYMFNNQKLLRAILRYLRASLLDSGKSYCIIVSRVFPSEGVRFYSLFHFDGRGIGNVTLLRRQILHTRVRTIPRNPRAEREECARHHSVFSRVVSKVRLRVRLGGVRKVCCILSMRGLFLYALTRWRLAALKISYKLKINLLNWNASWFIIPARH